MPSGNEATTGLRGSAVRLRKEGERLAARIDRDVRALTKRTRAELATDVRKLENTLRARATDAVRDIEKRTARLVGGVEKQAAKAAEDVLKRLHGATQSDVAALVRRVQELEARVAALEGLAPDESSSSV
jgi:hypothetical protein